jgi:hypothetical protein
MLRNTCQIQFANRHANICQSHHTTGVLIERRVCCPQCSSPSFSGEWQQPKQLQTELQDNQRRQCYKCEADVEIDYLIQPRGQKTGMEVSDIVYVHFICIISTFQNFAG